MTEKIEYLQDQAARCRRLASGHVDPRTRSMLLDLANEYDARAQLAGIDSEGRAPPE